MKIYQSTLIIPHKEIKDVSEVRVYYVRAEDKLDAMAKMSELSLAHGITGDVIWDEPAPLKGSLS